MLKLYINTVLSVVQVPSTVDYGAVPAKHMYAFKDKVKHSIIIINALLFRFVAF